MLKSRTILVTQDLHFGQLPIVLFANAPKSQIRDIVEILGSLDCSKSYFLGLCQKLLSEESPKSLKLSGFYKLSSGTSTYLGVLLDKCKRGLRKFFEASKLYPS